MDFKNYIKQVIADKEARANELRQKIKDATTADEVRSLGDELTSVETELRNAQSQLNALEEQEKRDNKQKQFDPMAAIATAHMPANGQQRSENEDPRASMEYRTAFKNYIQRGEIDKNVLQFEKRAGASGASTDLGVLIPTTVIQSIIKEVEKVYGQLYSRVKKTNIPGGVKYPIGSFTATFKRITETTVSDRQKSGEISGFVEFSYKIGEIRLARTLLQTVLSVQVFEDEFAKVISRAYVEAMDKEIMTGTDESNQCVGILTEAAKGGSGRIPTKNIIEFTEEEMADWTAWQTKLFAVIPLSMRGLRPEFAMTANTYEANIKTLKDANNRPVYNETFNPVDGAEIATFKGRQVVFVEEDVLKNFNDAGNGEYFGMYWVPDQAYAINSNMEFTVVDYFDHETNQYIKKALVINDGKILDPKYIYLLKKKVTG